MLQTRGYSLLAGILLVVSSGCRQVDYTAAQRYDRGLVICLGGAGGITGEVGRIRKGLNDGGVEYALEDFHWSRYNALNDQTNLAENQVKASQLARQIEAYRREYPGRPVHLIGVSAGTGLVVWALEDLGPGQNVDTVILIASSLHSRYDLSQAMEKVQGRVHSFYSPTDPVLIFGVPLAGTVDRRHSLIIGGLTGFKLPENAEESMKELYEEKLVQHRWELSDILRGNIGDHLGATNPGFVRKRIAPLLLGQNGQVGGQ